MVAISLLLALREPSLPIRVQGPVFACREFIIGPQLTPPGGIWLQLAFHRAVDVSYDGNGIGGNTGVYQSYGYASIEVTDSKTSAEPTRLIKWKAVYRPPNKSIDIQTIRLFVVDKDGILLRYSEETNEPTGTKRATVTFRDGSAFVQSTTPQERKSIEVPYQGREETARALFQPVYVDGKVTQYEKKIAFLDPFSGKWQDWSVIHRSKWNGTVDQKVVGGEAFNFETPAGYFSTYLMRDGQIFDVRFNENLRYLPDDISVKRTRG